MTNLRASSISEVVEQLAVAARASETISSIDIGSMNRVLEYTPEDMTVTVEAGITLAELQRRLAERGQWLPIDPPRPQSLTIGALLAANKSGSRRYGYGTIREHLLGIKVVLADGRVIKAGGKVVKNVAGYDLCKMFAGSRGTLGIIVEATFKVLPKPEKEQFVKAHASTAEGLAPLLEKLNASELTPIAIDIYNQERNQPALIIGFAGSREDVEWQLNKARELGLSEAATLEYNEQFWGEGDAPHSISVLPSKLIDVLRNLKASFVARAGNGIVYFRGEQPLPKSALPLDLMRRIKDAYDPKHLFPDLPW
jgi:FAD/FMN-containing dehydrogenase